MNRLMKTFAGAVVMTLAASLVMSAQAPVTLTLRSGETLSATLVDMGARGLALQVNGAERFIPKDQVAMVDFGAAISVKQSWFAGMTGNNNLVVFKNGDTLLADWTDVGGTSPLILRFNAGGHERELSSNDVARIYVVAPANIGTGGITGGAEGTVTVSATTAWNSTGLNVRTGEYLRFGVSGEIRFGTGPNDTATADGNPAGKVNTSFLRRLPIASVPVGHLIGRVGNGTPFSIGSAPQPVRMPANGTLMLGVNDVDFTDNSGAFRVVVTRGQAPSRR